MTLLDALVARPAVARSPVARELAVLMTCPVSISSASYPYLQQSAWTRLRDWVPHILGAGPAVLEAARLVVAETREAGADANQLGNVERAQRVIRQVVLTAAVTAPPELWLVRHVLAALDSVGISDRLLAGEVIGPGNHGDLRESELRIDLRLLMALGYLVRVGDSVRLRNADIARSVVDGLRGIEDSAGSGSLAWSAAAGGMDGEVLLPDLAVPLPERSNERDPGRWQATPAEIELGFRLVPLVLGLRAAGRIPDLLQHEVLTPRDICPAAAAAGERALAIFASAGVVDEDGRLGDVGRRVLERGPGPFGIIEAYHPYMARLDEILLHGRGKITVRRGTNIAASQDANRRTFEKANDALDRFCAETGFTYDVFVEHAVGRGEATRQRWERSGDAPVRYFGADLEDAAVDAAVAERDRGALPPGMRFVRNADIGAPAIVVENLEQAGVPAEGAVMIVGNGFHEIREQTDEAMTRVFEEYETAGFLLIFTEESALSVDALLETAWNTYHAGFRYVHERSGQGLRPAEPGPPSRFELQLPASWSECAERAGYVRAVAYCTRTRTIYPYTPPTGHNPSISVNHFFVPGRIARRLGLAPKVGT